MLRLSLRTGRKALLNSPRIIKSTHYAAVRFSSTETKSEEKPAAQPEVFTKLTDENDPQRDAFFKYSWGSWLKNDAAEKEKRFTKFSILGLNDTLNELYATSRDQVKNNGKVVPPLFNKSLTVTLPHNTTVQSMGIVKAGEKLNVTSMASLHEGKHHRIYKVDTNAGKSYVLRVPYMLDSEDAIANRIKSEVATMDFADLKLGIKVPKVLCFAVNEHNPLRTPFILEEYIHGDLLMRAWSPLTKDSEPMYKERLNAVIEPLTEFQTKLASITFNEFGSLYFANHYPEGSTEPYSGETDADLVGRWTIGPSTERALWKNKSAMEPEEQAKFRGPYPIEKPLDLIKNLALMEAENAKARLAQQKDETAPGAVSEQLLKDQVACFERLAALAPHLFNTESKTIPNVAELFKPRLCHAELDPMNVLVDAEGETYLFDFEGTTIKPFMFNNAPQFISYTGPKIFDLERDVENFKELSEAEKEQYEFMYLRTRNQYMWEFAVNEKSKDLIASVAPQAKLLRAPYVAALERKTDRDYLFIDDIMIQLQDVWELYAANSLVNGEKFPISWTAQELDSHAHEVQVYHEDMASQPFAVTGGWIPQDMFEKLLEQNVIEKQENGDFKVKSA